jgi:adenine/guanine/hypoxanthine permease
MRDFFRIIENGTTIKTEVLAGLTSFLATMYIIVINPAIISETGMPFSGVLTATVLVSAFSSIAMGLYANNPIVVAPGMGINAFFAYSVVIGMKVPWQTALGVVFWSGVIFLILSVFNVRVAIVNAIPRQIRYAITCGIGMFIAFLGFQNAGLVEADPVTLVRLGQIDSVVLVFVLGFSVTAYLMIRKVPGALVLGILSASLFAFPIGRWVGTGDPLVVWQGVFAAPDFSLLFQLDLLGSLKFSFLPVIFAFLFTDMFDSLSTFIGVAEAADLTDENGEPRHIRQSLIVDGVSTLISGLFGTSSGTSFIESAAGVEEGGRTGLTSVVSGLLFLPFLFLSPLLSFVPSVATAPTLCLVGVFMMKPILKINWHRLDDAIPSFLAMILIPLTYSIAHGIVWGFISWSIIKISVGKSKTVSPLLVVASLLYVLLMILVEQ